MAKKIESYGLLVVLLGVMLAAFLLSPLFPSHVNNFFFTTSMVLKSILLFLLPFLIFPFITAALLSVQKGATLLVLGTLGGVALSTFVAVWYAYGLASFLFPLCAFAPTAPAAPTDTVCALVQWSLDPFFSIEITLLLGIVFGVFFTYFPSRIFASFIKTYHKAAAGFFSKVFTPILPFYIFGFLVKIAQDYDCAHIMSSFHSLILMVVGGCTLYIFLYFLGGAGWSGSGALKAMRRAAPAWLSGFSTMSSMLTMPLTLKVAEENVKSKNVADVVIPATVNCHAIGDAISLSLISFAIYFLTFQHLPSLQDFLPFVVMLTVAQFGAISVAGGSVMVMIPTLTQHLSYSPEMIGLLTAIAIFMEPWGTSCNVMGNSGYVMMVDRFFNRFFGKKG